MDLQAALNAADVRLNGDRAWDLQLGDGPRLLRELWQRGSLGLGESYVRGDWDCRALDVLFERVLRAGLDQQLARGHGPGCLQRRLTDRLLNRLLDRQSRRRAAVAIQHHYDAEEAIYAAMLDSRRQYSCGFWQQASDLETAQLHKLELIAAKLRLEPGQHVLDIGCGWGGLAAHLAACHGVRVTGITLSARQWQWAEQRRRHEWRELPLTFQLLDYRDIGELDSRPFDRIVSVGMLEHVGPRHLRAFVQLCSAALRPEGLMLLHTIGAPRTSGDTDGWIDTHVFPDGRLPSARQLSGALEDLLLIEDWHNFGADYDRTLMAWHRNLEAAWPQLRQRLGRSLEASELDRLERHWRYYLLCCAGFFRARQGQLWQLVLSRAHRAPGPLAPYRSIRPGPCPLVAHGTGNDGAPPQNTPRIPPHQPGEHGDVDR